MANDNEMERFLDNLMEKMTLEEKIGQINLLPGNDVTTGAVMDSPLAQLIAEGNYLYVDKTRQVYNMTHNQGKYVFLSRPRRFGKTLLTSTLHSYFDGRRAFSK